MKLPIAPISPFIVRIWMPVILFTVVFLFLRNATPLHWLPSLPLLLLLAFMTTLAEVHEQGETLRVKWLWHSMDIGKQDVESMGPSFLAGIGAVQLRRFVLPWGRIYFVADWSQADRASDIKLRERESNLSSSIRDAVVSFVTAISGIMAGRAYSEIIPDLRIEALMAKIGGLAVAGFLCLVFAVVRKRNAGFANAVLFVAMSIAALVW